MEFCGKLKVNDTHNWLESMGRKIFIFPICLAKREIAYSRKKWHNGCFEMSINIVYGAWLRENGASGVLRNLYPFIFNFVQKTDLEHWSSKRSVHVQTSQTILPLEA